MDSSYFGIPKMGNSNEKSSSSRKNKKSGSEKPKQPQRGLGVAQLEQIRLRSQTGCNGGFAPTTPAATFHQDDVRLQGVPTYGVQQSATSSYNNPYYTQSSSPSTSSTSYAHHPNFMMVFGDSSERSNVRYHDSQASTAPRWNPNSVLESSAYPQLDSRHRIGYYEDSRHQRVDFLKSIGSSSQNSESNEHEEVDLELRLSL